MPPSQETIHEALRTGKMSELLRTHGRLRTHDRPTSPTSPTPADVGVKPLKKLTRQPRPPRPHTEHIGPWHRVLKEHIENLTHHREDHFCHGNCVTCPGHAQASVEGAQLRIEILTVGTTYLEEHVASNKTMLDNMIRAVLRHGGVRATIRLSDTDTRLICSVPITGRTFPPGKPLEGSERVDYVNELIEKAPRSFRQRPFNFSAAWPSPERAPEQFKVIGHFPDEACEANSAREHAEFTTEALVDASIPHRTGLTFDALEGNSILHVDFFVPLETLANPLKYSRLCSRLGYSSVDLRHFNKTAGLARDKLAELAEERAA